ncbi:hypothetical protein [Brachybacterium sp. GPGPB12]|uniref:hypothetical protein n=1 Tax=Brachybacterium sp. GPGPB12 TaxID=3023517 RepID=UPI00313460A6
MSGADRGVGRYVIWDSSPRAVARVRDAVVGHAATGTPRLVVQRLALHEEGREVGVHEIIDAILDVGGNLVAYPVREAVRADAAASAALDGALAQPRADIAEELTSAVDSLEVVLDRDGRREVRSLLAGRGLPGRAGGRSRPRRPARRRLPHPPPRARARRPARPCRRAGAEPAAARAGPDAREPRAPTRLTPRDVCRSGAPDAPRRPALRGLTLPVSRSRRAGRRRACRSRPRRDPGTSPRRSPRAA